jgi:hypothetical protein
MEALLAQFPAASPPALVAAAAAVLLAGVVRGYTGFGFALAAVPALSLLVAPVVVVPAVLLVAIVGGIEILPQAWRTVHWRSMRWLLAGAAAGTPVGLAALAALPADLMRAIIGAIVLAAVLLLARGAKFARAPRWLGLGIGALSGLLNGATAMGGPPVIIYFLASRQGVVIGRASLLVYFFFLSIGGTAMAAIAGLVSVPTLLLAAFMLPFMAIGNGIGARLFDRSAAAHYQRVALVFLGLVAVLALLRAAL